MEHCPHRPHALRAVVVLLVVLVASRFAFQVRDGGALVPESARQSEVSHFVVDTFPTAEATVVSGR